MEVLQPVEDRCVVSLLKDTDYLIHQRFLNPGEPLHKRNLDSHLRTIRRVKSNGLKACHRLGEIEGVGGVRAKTRPGSTDERPLGGIPGELLS